MNKREAVLSVIDPQQAPPYIPAAFFLHFPAEFHEGKAAVDKHLEYFRYTEMDFIKIQYERTFPPIPDIKTPEDWAKMPRYGLDFYEGQIRAVEGLIKAAKHEAVVILTLYSPFMCAGHTAGSDLLTEHLNHDPEKVKPGLEAITDSLLAFVRECIRLGIDGYYTSTQGGEAGRFADASTFARYVKPYDLALMNEINDKCEFNILHVCDYQRDYDDFTPLLDYPGDVVSCPLKLAGKRLSVKEASSLFGGRPIMGGMDRLGILANGTIEQVKAEAEAVLSEAPDRFILGADCTVPAETPWHNLRAAVETAHQHKTLTTQSQ